jgi:hypothetical protein
MRLNNSTLHRLSLVVLPIVAVLGAVVGLVHAIGTAAQRSASPLGTAFTYQGYLTDGGGPADGPFDFIFTLHDDPAGGAQVGRTIEVADLTVGQGLFSVELDFEQGVGPVLDGTALWLGIQVRPGSETGAYTTLTPRQPLTPAPYAVYSARSDWSGLAGVPAGLDDGDDDTTYSAGAGLVLTGTTFAISDTHQLPQTCNGGQIISWNGAGWSCQDPGSGGSGWSLVGNAGTTAGTNFLGTTDDEPLELWVNNLRALLLEPGLSSPNIIAGYGGNDAGSGVSGATVGGGGRDLAINQAGGGYSTVSGGAGNTAGGYASAVGGGEGNTAGGNYGAVGGGAGNAVDGSYATVGGGQNNTATATRATIGGGQNNSASGTYATVGGGQGNLVTATLGAIGGGANNGVYADYAAVGGGGYNSVSAAYGAIAGGGPADPGNPTTSNNQVIDDYGAIGGGGGNTAGSDDDGPPATPATYATVGGGKGNTSGATFATVSGGTANQAVGYGATIGGGQSNVVSDTYAAVGGGYQNEATAYAATIGGGRNNAAGANYATVGGGYNNEVVAGSGTIPGGVNNFVGGSFGFAAGFQARAEHAGSFVWSDSQGGSFASTGSDQFLIDASGGVGIGTNSPAGQLSVAGNTEITGDLTLDGGATILGSGQLTLRSVFTLPRLILQGPSAVYASGPDIYVTTASTNTLVVINASDPDAPQLASYSSANLLGPTDVHVVGQRAYVPSFNLDQLAVFDVSDPAGLDTATTDAAGRENDGGWVRTQPVAVYVAGNYAFVASQGNDGLGIFNVADINHMGHTGFITTSLDAPSDVFVSAGFAYVTSRDNDRLVVFDLSHIEAPVWVGETSEMLDGPVAVHVRGNQAYVLSHNTDSLVAFDISSRSAITLAGQIATSLTGPRSLYVSGDLAYVAFEGDPVTAANCGLAVFDISDPANMKTLSVQNCQAEPEKPVGVYGSGNYLYVVNERSDSLAIYEVNHLQAPAATIGSARAGYLEVSDSALINNDLVVDGGLNVGSGGAWIGGELAVAGEHGSVIMGGLSIGEAGKTVSVTFGIEDYGVRFSYPTHMLDVHGDARFRVNEHNHLTLNTPAGSGEDAAIDFFPAEVIPDEIALTEAITPSARIIFNAPDPLTPKAGIDFYTRGTGDQEAALRLEILSDGRVEPGADQAQDLGATDARWLTVYTKNPVDVLSDGRYKEHIASLDYGLEEVKALRPVTYNWRDGPEDEVHFGLVAQEVAQVLPELVRGDENEGPLSLRYGELVPVLVSAVQEQQEEIAHQSEQITGLEARLEALEQGGAGAAGPGWLKELRVLGVGGLALLAGVLLSRRRPGET